MSLPNYTLNTEVSDQLKELYQLLLSYKELQAQLDGVKSQLESLPTEFVSQAIAAMAGIGMLIIES